MLKNRRELNYFGSCVLMLFLTCQQAQAQQHSLSWPSEIIGLSASPPTSIGYTTMDVQLQRRRECTQLILEIKRTKKLTWEEIAAAVNRSPVWVTACILGEASMDEVPAQKLIEFLGLDESIKQILMTPPIKGQVPVGTLVQDPCIYRLQEVTLVYGNTVKELIQEKFGDGIMSAIDFKMEVDREEDPDGDRVKITMSGKFLPYKRW